MKRWIQKHYRKPGDPSYACIEQYGNGFYSMIILDEVSLMIDKDTVEDHETFKEAAYACDLKIEDFEEENNVE